MLYYAHGSTCAKRGKINKTPSTHIAKFFARSPLSVLMSSTTNNTPDRARARAIWRSCIASAFRTALACAIVGCTTFFGPPIVTRQVAFPAFSYVTVILVVTDATLGDTIRSCWLALYATIQTVGPAILSLWLIGPDKLSNCTTSVLVAMAAFVVALPESTHLVAKRIALGQIVITYVIGFINGAKTEAVMHPIHVAASTALGVLACVLALLLPYPRLACSKVKQNCKLYAENASERLKLFGMAFCAEDQTSAHASISQAKSLAITGTELLKNIKSMQESMQWERLPFKILESYYMTPGDKLQDLEIPLRGMEMALTNTPFTITSLNGALKNDVEEHLSLTLKEVKSWVSCDNTSVSSTGPESNADNVMQSLQTLQTIHPTQKNLPSLFFIFCLKLRRESMTATPTPSHQKDDDSFATRKKDEFFLAWFWRIILAPKRKRILAAFKCSISLGLAVLLGLIYSKKDGIWSGLPVAISLASAREAAFKVANLKAQGTVLGTVYGVLGCFLFEKFLAVRFMSLLPWFIFTSFLRRSKMYAQAGGISAVIGAVLILGRENFGPPSEFAIARIVETFIGLSCSIMVDILMQPTRASTLAKLQLSRCLETLHDCIGFINLGASKAMLEESQKRLKADVVELGKFIGEAEVEPNFWFLPFHSACYGKLLASLSKMVDLLLFGTLAIGFLEQESLKLDQDKLLTNDLKVLKEMLASLIKCFKEVTLIKSLAVLENELEKNNISSDIELGKSPNSKLFMLSGSEEDDMEKIITSYVQHLKEVVDNSSHAVEEGEEDDVKSQMVLNLSALGFCMSGLVRKTREIGKAIEELIQWENPTSHINLFEISCKIHALYDNS